MLSSVQMAGDKDEKPMTLSDKVALLLAFVWWYAGNMKYNEVIVLI